MLRIELKKLTEIDDELSWKRKEDNCIFIGRQLGSIKRQLLCFA